MIIMTEEHFASQNMLEEFSLIGFPFRRTPLAPKKAKMNRFSGQILMLTAIRALFFYKTAKVPLG